MLPACCEDKRITLKDLYVILHHPIQSKHTNKCALVVSLLVQLLAYDGFISGGYFVRHKQFLSMRIAQLKTLSEVTTFNFNLATS